MHDTQTITDAEELWQVRAHHEHSLTRGRELADDSVDLDLSCDVDSTGGFIKQQHVYIVMKQASERALLLIPSGEVPCPLARARTTNPEALDPTRHDRCAL